ncbi:MAG: molybdenum cofactor biosynthesis protein B [Pseudomonadota bacterium]|nr:molybdenum cofactor biosynthesis protein B [Pseudomonadota bacterium]
MGSEFIPVNIAILTISDTRTKDNDASGDVLQDKATADGHSVNHRNIVADDTYRIRAVISQWLINDDIDVIITTGGTGLTGRDGTPEAVKVLFDKEIEGFGELFRARSYDVIKTSTVQSRAIAGLANGKFIFCLPGSKGACITGWDEILHDQLNATHKPCNFIDLIPRLLEK